MSKARMIGAGMAGSTNYNTNVNLNTAGGTKKQGYPSAVPNRVNNRELKRARGENNNMVFPMNQLSGGVHKPIRIHDGNTNFAPYNYYQPKYVPPQYGGALNSFLVGQGLNKPPVWQYPFRAGIVFVESPTGTATFLLNNIATPFPVGAEVLVTVTPVGDGTGTVNLTAAATRTGFSWVATGGIAAFYYLAVGQTPS
jgi:hypothetical protein